MSTQANQTQIPIIQHDDPAVVQLQQNVNKVLRNLNNQVGASVSQQDSSNLIATIKDIKPQATASGTFTAGAWRTRDLLVLDDPFSIGIKLNSNQFTLPSGTYYIDASAPAKDVAQHKAKLANISDLSDQIMGTNEITNDGATCSFIKGVFKITDSKIFEIQHFCQTTVATVGFGGSNSLHQGVEVYTQVVLTKLG